MGTKMKVMPMKVRKKCHLPRLSCSIGSSDRELGALAMHSFPAISPATLFAAEPNQLPRVPLGVCDHALRAMKPTADQVLDYAIEQRLDAVQLNSLRPLESRDDAYLRHLREKAAGKDIGFYLGAGSISDRSTRFRDNWGTGRELLREGIRVAAALDSPIVVCRIGTIEDRFTEGGIEPHVEAVIKTMTSLRAEALDAGVKFAFENHAGDLRTEELLPLIEETGTDICGAMLDFGNAIWAMEDPINTIERLGRNILCVSVRDVMLWETDGRPAVCAQSGRVVSGRAVCGRVYFQFAASDSISYRRILDRVSESSGVRNRRFPEDAEAR